MASSLFNRLRSQTPKDSKLFVAKNLDITEQVHEILERKGWSQKDLARALGKQESEISKWLSGLHNLTLKTITKIEAILGEDIICTPAKAREVLVKENFFYSQSTVSISIPLGILNDKYHQAGMAIERKKNSSIGNISTASYIAEKFTVSEAAFSKEIA